MTTDRELREQIEEAEAKLRNTRRSLMDLKDTYPARCSKLAEDKHSLLERRRALKARIDAVKRELEKVSDEIGSSLDRHISPVYESYDGQGDLTVVDGVVNALFGQTPDWAQRAGAFQRFKVRFFLGMGKKP